MRSEVAAAMVTEGNSQIKYHQLQSTINVFEKSRDSGDVTGRHSLTEISTEQIGAVAALARAARVQT